MTKTRKKGMLSDRVGRGNERFASVTDVCLLQFANCPLYLSATLLNVEAAAQHSSVNTSLFGQELSSLYHCCEVSIFGFATGASRMQNIQTGMEP
jgi:hypothetical protein